MPAFDKGPSFRTPFARNQWLRSTQDLGTDSRTVAAATVPSVTIDGFAQKVLQPGTVLAVITGTGGGGLAADVGKVGPFSAAAADGRQTLTNIVGICNTFLPWQLLHRDVEVAVAYDAVAVQQWCIEYDGSNLAIPLTDTTAAALVAKKGLDITFIPRANDVR